MSSYRRSAAALLLIMLISLLAAGIASAQPAGTSTITGTLTDQQNGLAVSGAVVSLYRNNEKLADKTTDASGAFSFTGITPGAYNVAVTAVGYNRFRSDDVLIGPAQATANVKLVASRASSGTEAGVIGRVSTTANATLQSTTVINTTVSADEIQRVGQLRVGQALLAQPGLSSFNLDSAPGDDLNISIRGFRPSEAQALVDGVPVGPIGVFNGTGGGYNYQLSPTFGLKDVRITYGTGGATLSQTSAIAGTIDFRTIDPTTKSQLQANYGYGTQRRQQSFIEATGTKGAFSYAIIGAVSGTWGGFHNETNLQSNLLPNDNTTANQLANTWLVTGNYVLRNDVVKLKYRLGPQTAITLAGYVATSWDDKTGEGDNDFATPEYVGYVFDQIAGGTPGCAGVSIKTDADPNACYNRQQYVNSFSGPSGGTPLAYQALRLQNYDGKLTTTLGFNNLTFEGFLNNYNQYYDRNGGGFINAYGTTGIRITDDIVSGRNNLGFGYVGIHQAYVPSTYTPAKSVSTGGLGSAVETAFVSDEYDLTHQLSLFANLNYVTQSVTNQYSLNPRISLVAHVTPNDIFRFSYGQGNEAPNVSLLAQPVTITTQAGAVNPACGAVSPYSIGTAPYNGLKGEQANDIELGYGHHFRGDSAIQLVLYDSEVTNAIFSTTLSAPSLGIAVPQPYIDRYNAQCGTTMGSAANFGFTAAANAGAARFRGINVNGRERVTRPLFFDYSLSLTSARYFNIPIVSQQANPLLVDGGQIDKVPYVQGSVSADYTFAGDTEVRIDGYYVGHNNGLLRPGYTYANAFISHTFGRLNLNLGATNLFNSQYDQYGRFGYATFQPENSFGTDANAIQQQYSGLDGERFGLPQQSFIFSATVKI